MLVEDPLPDIIHYFGADLKELGMEGGLIPLEDLIDSVSKYAFESSEKALIAREGIGQTIDFKG